MKNKRLYKVGIEYNEPLKGYISKDEERARILYDNPDNKNKKEIGLEIIEEYKDIPIAEPVIYVEKPERTKYQSDLKQARRNAVNQARKQQRTVKSVPNINPQTKMEYINKPKIGLGQNTYIVQPKVQEEFTIGKRENKTSTYKKQKNYEEIAEMFYPSMEVKSEIAPLKNKTILPQSGMYIEPQTSTISDAEKLLYPNGTLGEMAPKKLYDLTKTDTEYEEIANVMYPTTSDKSEINELREKSRMEEKLREEALRKKILQYRVGAAIIIAVGAVPIAREAILTTVLGRTAVGYLVPIVGRKISELLVPMVIESFISGGIAGLGEGILNDENPIKSAITGAVMGMLLGIGIGLGIGRIGKEYAMREIERAANKDGLLKKYYADYIEGIEGKTKEIIEYRRLKAGGGKAGEREVLYDKIDKKNRNKEVRLSEEEYANLMHELNTNLTLEQKSKKIITKHIRNYEYKVINNGFNDYIVIDRRLIK